MTRPATTELLLIRHAPSIPADRLAGRTDVAADCSDRDRLAAVATSLPGISALYASPARRCLETAAGLWPGRLPETRAALWEQDFGSWEGRPFVELPDLGPLSRADLVRHRAPGGESFLDVCARAGTEIEAIARTEAGRSIGLVVHAGTIRAALALAIGTPEAAIAFTIAPLSATRLAFTAPGGWSVVCVNQTLPGTR
ncbi:MAG: histidine phosphatase family protein [Rhizobiales bacterium]|nr:histidine phosphatase family protein [Hyphomicrobiales bacterium]